MATYSPSKYAEKLNKGMAKFNASSKPLRELIYKMVSITEKRIFDKGQDSTGSDIGTYSTNPLYVNPTLATNRKKFPTGGNTKNKGAKSFNLKTKKVVKSGTIFLNGNPRHSRYFPNYTAYKQSQGMALLGNKVNLQITKHFRRAFLTKSFPLFNRGKTLVAQMGVMPSTVNPIGKIHGLMTKYPQAFKFSKSEKAFFEKELKEIFLFNLK